MSIVTLIDGRQVDSASDEWRHECEARMVAGLATLSDRRMYLDEVERRRGQPAAERLRETMRAMWEAKTR